MSDLDISCRVLEETLKACRVLEKTLKASGKHFVCPLCRTTYSRADLVFKHCRHEAKEKDDMSDEQKRICKIHKALGAVTMRGDFREFRESLATACGQDRKEIPVPELPLDLTQSGRRSYGSCLGTNFIVDQMATSTAARLQILKNLAHNAGIHYACPSCWTGFANNSEVTKHCAIESDENHRGLLSEKVDPFMELYVRLLGRNIDLAHMEVDFDEYGVPHFGKCFRIDNILGHLSECWNSLRCILT
ncbi:hypothetical protein N7490_006254 [Penicillium lividum]|nr:hypothetical protein N7490_006254 [Penicillium lividum]